MVTTTHCSASYSMSLLLAMTTLGMHTRDLINGIFPVNTFGLSVAVHSCRQLAVKFVVFRITQKNHMLSLSVCWSNTWQGEHNYEMSSGKSFKPTGVATFLSDLRSVGRAFSWLDTCLFSVYRDVTIYCRRREVTQLVAITTIIVIRPCCPAAHRINSPRYLSVNF